MPEDKKKDRKTADEKPTISPENHDANVGQRGSPAETEGAKPTIERDNHDANVGQRGNRD